MSPVAKDDYTSPHMPGTEVKRPTPFLTPRSERYPRSAPNAADMLSNT